MNKKWEQFKTTPAYTWLQLTDHHELVDADVYTEFCDDNPDSDDNDFVEYMIEFGYQDLLDDFEYQKNLRI
jgi:hypothetical protein